MLTTKLLASLFVVATTATSALAAPCNEPAAPAPTAQTVVIQAPVAYAPPTTTIVAPRPIWHGPALPIFPTKIANDVHFNARGYKVINVGEQAGQFRKLILQNEGGRDKITKIEVVFCNHQTETFTENQVLQGRGPTLTIDLAHKQGIEKVVVFGSDRAELTHAGMSEPAFTVVAA